jgi:hypothetical protein
MAGDGASTEFTYHGEMSTDLWWIGERWGRVVAGPWERAVSTSMQSIQAESERRAQR